jgi:hypothetical protein
VTRGHVDEEPAAHARDEDPGPQPYADAGEIGVADHLLERFTLRAPLHQDVERGVVGCRLAQHGRLLLGEDTARRPQRRDGLDQRALCDRHTHPISPVGPVAELSTMHACPQGRRRGGAVFSSVRGVRERKPPDDAAAQRLRSVLAGPTGGRPAPAPSFPMRATPPGDGLAGLADVGEPLESTWRRRPAPCFTRPGRALLQLLNRVTGLARRERSRVTTGRGRLGPRRRLRTLRRPPRS